MELDILKDAWASHNKKLDKYLKVNENLMRRMNLDKAKKETNKPLVTEIVNITFLIAVAAYALILSFKMLEDSMFSIPGLISIIFSGCLGVMGFIKIKHLLNLDYENSTVINLQKKMTETQLLFLKLRKLEYLIMPFYMITLAPILLKGLLNMDIYSMLQETYMQVVVFVGIIVIIALTILSNKFLYDRKMKNAQKSLAEIIKYEQDDTSTV
jgi:cytochrome bd-type quinol oxidase subunit 2